MSSSDRLAAVEKTFEPGYQPLQEIKELAQLVRVVGGEHVVFKMVLFVVSEVLFVQLKGIVELRGAAEHIADAVPHNAAVDN
ncbi:hypothetical protein LTR12_013971 [Friedmanniomyces endolithicus]|nr:hypothetical protein LTR12_013971 [Friedmanniomyces endolithicus]